MIEDSGIKLQSNWLQYKTLYAKLSPLTVWWPCKFRLRNGCWCVQDFVPFVYSNLLPFVYQLIFGQKEQYMASLPANISPAKREHLSK